LKGNGIVARLKKNILRGRSYEGISLLRTKDKGLELIARDLDFVIIDLKVNVSHFDKGKGKGLREALYGVRGLKVSVKEAYIDRRLIT
jgi:hypothetical protein